MTEAQWFASREPRPLLNALYNTNKVSDRKFRLCACACFDMLTREPWRVDLDERIPPLVAVAERFADGWATDRERIKALRAATKLAYESVAFCTPTRFAVENRAWASALGASDGIAHDLSRRAAAHERAEVLARANEALVRAVRESFYPLQFHLRPITFTPAWRTSDVMLLANGIYEEKAFDRMPILADALQDAGCDSETLLAHFRDTSLTHVRGCWALDLVLGKD